MGSRTEAEIFAGHVRAAMPQLMAGAFRFWGCWFGKPYDNIHTITWAASDGDILKLSFDAGEVLTVWRPARCVADGAAFRIGDAERVRWEWFYYGAPRTPRNLYFEEFRRTSEGFESETNVAWATLPLRPDGQFPAVEMF